MEIQIVSRDATRESKPSEQCHSKMDRTTRNSKDRKKMKRFII